MALFSRSGTDQERPLRARFDAFAAPSARARFLRIADVHGGIVAQQETSPEAFRLLDTLSTRGPERIRMEPADSGREASPR
jgi:hypothetical protein